MWLSKCRGKACGCPWAASPVTPGVQEGPERTSPMLGEVTVGTAEVSGASCPCVGPEGSCSGGPVMERWPPIVSGDSPALVTSPHPFPRPLQSSAVGPRSRKSGLLLWLEDRDPGVAKQSQVLGQEGKQNKAKPKKLSDITVSPRGKDLLRSSQLAWAVTCRARRTSKGPGPGGGLMQTGGEAWPRPWGAWPEEEMLSPPGNPAEISLQDDIPPRINRDVQEGPAAIWGRA